MKTIILLATHNVDKVNEIRSILINSSNKYDIISLKDLDDQFDVPENGTTFLANAIIKAKYYYNKYGYITLADDSGLKVESLNGRPGVNSKRYSNSGNDLDNNNKLLSELSSTKNNNRSAYFETVVALITEDGHIETFNGRLNGVISNKMLGSEGFGYDPLFIPNGYNKTLSELGQSVKNEISHRKIAFKKVEGYLNENINNK